MGLAFVDSDWLCSILKMCQVQGHFSLFVCFTQIKTLWLVELAISNNHGLNFVRQAHREYIPTHNYNVTTRILKNVHQSINSDFYEKWDLTVTQTKGLWTKNVLCSFSRFDISTATRQSAVCATPSSCTYDTMAARDICNSQTCESVIYDTMAGGLIS